MGQQSSKSLEIAWDIKTTVSEGFIHSQNYFKIK